MVITLTLLKKRAGRLSVMVSAIEAQEYSFSSNFWILVKLKEKFRRSQAHPQSLIGFTILIHNVGIRYGLFSGIFRKTICALERDSLVSTKE